MDFFDKNCVVKCDAISNQKQIGASYFYAISKKHLQIAAKMKLSWRVDFLSFDTFEYGNENILCTYTSLRKV